MDLVTKKLSEIKPYQNNPRRNDDAVDAVAESIRQLGLDCRFSIIENKYLITETGDIYRLYRKGKLKIEKQKKRRHTNGYMRGVICGKDVYIHRLVAKAFCPNPNGYKEVNHIDGNKENNNAYNLEWCTRSQNNKHAYETGLRDYSELTEMAKMPKRKLTDDQAREIRNSDKSQRELSLIYNVGRTTISDIIKHKTYRDVI